MLKYSPYRQKMTLAPYDDDTSKKLERSIILSSKKNVEFDYQTSMYLAKRSTKILTTPKKKIYSKSLNESSEKGSRSGSPISRKSSLKSSWKTLFDAAMNRRFNVEKDLHIYNQKLNYGETERKLYKFSISATGKQLPGLAKRAKFLDTLTEW